MKEQNATKRLSEEGLGTESQTKRAKEVIGMIAAVEGLNKSDCEDEQPTIDMKNNQPDEKTLEEIKNAELERFKEYNVYTAVPRSSARGKILTMTWVIEQRSGERKARLCARPFGKAPRHADEVYCPTPFPSTIRVLLALAAVRNYAVRFFDVSRAFLHTPIREDVWIEPPVEWKGNGDEVWHMNCTVYGLQEAMVDFDTHFDDVFCGKVEPDGRDMMQMTRHVSDPACWSGEGTHVVKHVDDGVVVGPAECVNEVLAKLGQYFKLKVTDELATGRPEKLLGGYICRIKDGFVQYCKESLIDEFVVAITGKNGRRSPPANRQPRRCANCGKVHVKFKWPHPGGRYIG